MKKRLRKESKYNSAALKAKDRGEKSAFKGSRCFQAPRELLWHARRAAQPPPALRPPSTSPEPCVGQSHVKGAKATAHGTDIAPRPPHGSCPGDTALPASRPPASTRGLWYVLPRKSSPVETFHTSGISAPKMQKREQRYVLPA